MKYRNVENWKTEIKKLAKSKKLDIQDVQQRYVLEEFAEKISLSKYSNMLVLKGGFVVSTLLGLDTRMTRDIDITCKSTIYSLDEMKTILQEVIETKSESFFDYSIGCVVESQIFNKHFNNYKEKQYPHMNITLKEIFEKFRLINKMIKTYRKTEVLS